MFQYKIIHRILSSKSLLYKMKKVDSPIRPLFSSKMHIISLSNTCLENARKLNLSRYYLAINHFDYYSKMLSIRQRQR